MSRSRLRVGIVANEASGDILGAALVSELRTLVPDACFEGVAGPRMLESGCETLFPMERLSVMGLTEVLGHLPELTRLRRGLVRAASKLEGLPLAAGYIDLRSVRYLRHFFCVKASMDDWIGVLERWEEHVAAALDLLYRGELAPCWMRTDCSAPCAFQCLCGKALCGA